MSYPKVYLTIFNFVWLIAHFICIFNKHYWFKGSCYVWYKDSGSSLCILAQQWCLVHFLWIIIAGTLILDLWCLWIIWFASWYWIWSWNPNPWYNLWLWLTCIMEWLVLKFIFKFSFWWSYSYKVLVSICYWLLVDSCIQGKVIQIHMISYSKGSIVAWETSYIHPKRGNFHYQNQHYIIKETNYKALHKIIYFWPTVDFGQMLTFWSINWLKSTNLILILKTLILQDMPRS